MTTMIVMMMMMMMPARCSITSSAPSSIPHFWRPMARRKGIVVPDQADDLI